MACNIREVRQILLRIQKNFECAICLDLLSDPYSTKCNHQFCRDCIFRVISERSSVCPLCKESLSKRSLNRNTSLSAIVEAIKDLVEAAREDTGAICTPPLRVSSQLTGTPGIRAFSLAHPTPQKCKQQFSSDSSEDEQKVARAHFVPLSRIRNAVQRQPKNNVRRAKPSKSPAKQRDITASTPLFQPMVTTFQTKTPLSNLRRTPAAKKLQTSLVATSSTIGRDAVSSSPVSLTTSSSSLNHAGGGSKAQGAPHVDDFKREMLISVDAADKAIYTNLPLLSSSSSVSDTTVATVTASDTTVATVTASHTTVATVISSSVSTTTQHSSMDIAECSNTEIHLVPDCVIDSTRTADTDKATNVKPCQSSAAPSAMRTGRARKHRSLPSKLKKETLPVDSANDYRDVRTGRKGSVCSFRIYAAQRKQALLKKQDELAYLLEKGDVSPNLLAGMINDIDQHLLENSIVNVVDTKSGNFLNEKARRRSTSRLVLDDKVQHRENNEMSTLEDDNRQHAEQYDNKLEVQGNCSKSQQDVEMPDSNNLNSSFLPYKSLLLRDNDNVIDAKAVSKCTIAEASMSCDEVTDSGNMGLETEVELHQADKAVVCSAVDESFSEYLVEVCEDALMLGETKNEEVLESPHATDSLCCVIDPMAHMATLKTQGLDSDTTMSPEYVTNISLSMSFGSHSAIHLGSPIEKEVPLETSKISSLSTSLPSSLSSSKRPKTSSDSLQILSPPERNLCKAHLSCSKASGKTVFAESDSDESKRCWQSEDFSRFVGISDAGTSDEFTTAIDQSSDVIDDFIPQTPPVRRHSSAPQLPLYNIFSPLIVSPRSRSAPLINMTRLSSLLSSPQGTVASNEHARNGSKQTYTEIVDVGHVNCSLLSDSKVVLSSQPSPTILLPVTTHSPSILTHHVTRNQSLTCKHDPIMRDSMSGNSSLFVTSNTKSSSTTSCEGMVMNSKANNRLENCDDATQAATLNSLSILPTQSLEFVRSEEGTRADQMNTPSMSTSMSTCDNYDDQQTASESLITRSNVCSKNCVINGLSSCDGQSTNTEKPRESIVIPDTQMVETTLVNRDDTVTVVKESDNNDDDDSIGVHVPPVSLTSRETDTQRDTSDAHFSTREGTLAVFCTVASSNSAHVSAEKTNSIIANNSEVNLPRSETTDINDETAQASSTRLISTQLSQNTQFTVSQCEHTGLIDSQELDVQEVKRQLDRRSKELAEVNVLLSEELTHCNKEENGCLSQLLHETNEDPPSSPSPSPTPPPGPPLMPVSVILSTIDKHKQRRLSHEQLHSSWPGSSETKASQKRDVVVEQSQSIFAGLKSRRSVSLEPPAKKANTDMVGFNDCTFGANVMIPSVSLENQCEERMEISGKTTERSAHTNSRIMSFITSGLTKTQMARTKQLAMKYGGRLASCFNRNTTHVICKTDENRIASRTMKFLLGVAAGKWVVDYCWVQDCLNGSSLLPENDYEVAGDTGSRHRGGPQAARLRAESNSPRLLSGQTVALLGDFMTIHKDQLRQLLEVAGARSVSDKEAFDYNETERRNVIVVCDPECSEVKDHWMGLQGTVTLYWVTDSLAANTILPLCQYSVGMETCSYTNSDIMPSPSLIPGSL